MRAFRLCGDVIDRAGDMPEARAIRDRTGAVGHLVVREDLEGRAGTAVTGQEQVLPMQVRALKPVA